tara:strand:+ start:355 stop:1200 length:846 start_codon:yes stop_codon:yes gene_type:complete
MNKVIFIADFFADEVPGGGELNNQQLIQILQKRGVDVLEIKSQNVSPQFLQEQNKNTKFIIANFIGLTEENKSLLKLEKEYIIYEHDHKYVKTRNPADYKDFIAPKDQIINFEFYKNSKAILCQSDFHANIVRANLNLDNIKSVGGNLWSHDILDFMYKISLNKKQATCAIMSSDNWHKNTPDAIKLCKIKGWKYDLIPRSDYQHFLTRLGKSKKFVFLPKTPETLSRIVVEARMMGLSVVTNNLVGATKEDWFKLKGIDLIDIMVGKRKEIPDLVQKVLQ